MKKPSWIILILTGAAVVLLLVGILLRASWDPRGPDLAYWLSNMAISWSGVFAGILIMIRTRNRKQIPLFLLGMVLTLIGSLIFLNTIRFMSMGCKPMGC